MDLLGITLVVSTARNSSNMHLIEEVHQHHLRVTLSSVSGTLTLTWFANFDADHVGYDMARAFIQTRIDFAHVVLLRAFAKRQEAQRLRVKIGISAKDIEHDARSRSVVT